MWLLSGWRDRIANPPVNSVELDTSTEHLFQSKTELIALLTERGGSIRELEHHPIFSDDVVLDAIRSSDVQHSLIGGGWGYLEEISLRVR